ncbi:SOAT-like protein [Mya arenaria]|uniref:SOAT-like protein n=1 Tax=Mya arenaria TaxID=6604 RepID=A0ABY7DZP9_MYAAR|nr:SOAT-like protein [Mya arenaria]
MDALLITPTVLLMLSFGCSMHVKHIKDYFSRPIGVVLEVLLHLIVLPYLFYALDQVMMWDRYDEMSLTVLATCPAGGVSNLYVFYADGDLALGFRTLLIPFVLFGKKQTCDLLPRVIRALNANS